MPETSSQSSALFDWESLRRRLQEATTALSAAHAADDDDAVLQERARLLAASTEAPLQPVETLDVILFTLSGERYALEARLVREVTSDPELTPVPNTPAFLRGIYNLRGEVLAVMDLRPFLNVSSTATCDRWLIVIGEERPDFGIIADDVNEVCKLTLESVMRTASAGECNALIRGVTSEALVLLDSHAMLNDTRLWVHAAATPSRMTT